MGSYTFKWEHPAEDVHVTGTFDNWSKSVKLDKKGGIFQKTVDFKDPAAKVYYKYVVDNVWTVNESFPKEPDHEGNINNYLTHSDYTPLAPTISTVAPGATSLSMAGQQPIESREKEALPTPSEIPGGFPETPSNELDKTIGINPMPAADGAINPVKLAPGEEIPKYLKNQDLNANVKLDKESYEKGDTLSGVDMNLPPASETTIPEVGFALTKEKPAEDVTISTVGTGATTVGLAGQVPLEPKQREAPRAEDATISTVGTGATTLGLAGQVPKEPKQTEIPRVVKESQEAADAPPEVPATSTDASGSGTEKTAETTTIASTVAAAGGALASAAIVAKNTLTEKATPALQQASEVVNNNLPETVKEKLPVSVQETLSGQTKEEVREEISPEIPEEVKKSIIEANKEPEAAANTAAVQDKREMEKQLQKEVEKVPAEGESKGGDVKQEDTVPVKTAPAPSKQTVPAPVKETTPANGSNGHGTGVVGSSGKTETSQETKKKHRISGFFSKLKHKFTD